LTFALEICSAHRRLEPCPIAPPCPQASMALVMSWTHVVCIGICKRAGRSCICWGRCQRTRWCPSRTASARNTHCITLNSHMCAIYRCRLSSMVDSR
jgi:hypothetical protein